MNKITKLADLENTIGYPHAFLVQVSKNTITTRFTDNMKCIMSRTPVAQFLLVIKSN